MSFSRAVLTGSFTAAAAAIGLLAVTHGAALAEAVQTSMARPTAGPSSVALPDGSLTLSRQTDATTLRLDGIITPGVEQLFLDALHSAPKGAPLVIELDSPGGFTAPGYRMIDAILAEREAGRPVATRVKAGESCESMCVGLYLSGFPRYAAPSAEFMVHAPRSAQSGLMTLRSTNRMMDRLVELGAARPWIEKVAAAGGFSGAIDYRARADRLAADHANIVTDLLR